MAGPACVIIVAEPDVLPEFDRLITRIASAREGGDSFWITDTRALGGRYVGEPRPFVCGSYSFPGDASERRQIERSLGKSIQCVIEVGAMCNDDEDWDILKDVAVAIADELNAVVALESELPGPSRVGRTFTVVSSEGEAYTVADAEAVRYLSANGVALFVK